MVSLTNSKSSQDVLGQQLSEAIALGSYELKLDEAAKYTVKSKHGTKSLPNFQVTTSNKLSKKDLKKLREKTKRTLLSLKAREADYNSEDDDELQH